MKLILQLVPTKKIILLFFDFGLLFSPGFEPLSATFKAVLIAVDMTKALQTKCKTCFGGPKMILHALWINTFFLQKSSMVFFTTQYPR